MCQYYLYVRTLCVSLGRAYTISVTVCQAEESVQDELEAAKVCKRRIEHLREYEHLPPTAVNQWHKKRLDRMLVEYFLRAGYYNSAIKLAQHSGIEVGTQE